MSGIPYHAWTHRPKLRGGTDPIRLFVEPSLVYHKISDASTNTVTILDEPGVLTGYYICCTALEFRYVKLFDQDTDPTLGTDVPKLTFGIPARTAANIGFDNVIEFDVGIAIATTVSIADAATDAVSGGDLGINIYYHLPVI